MALTNIQLVNLAIGNTPNNPYYPLLTDEDIESILESTDDDVNAAIKRAANSAYMYIISIPTREKIGDIELYNTYASEYRLALGRLLSSTDYTLPVGIMPYAGGISEADYVSNKRNGDRHLSKISKAIEDTERNPYWWIT
jgi:hypothetical protein